jgi:signal transduction histidine kinase
MRLVHQLVDVSRIASGRLHLDVEPVDLGRLAHTVVGRHRHTASSIECQLALGVTGNVDGTWDRRRLDHAISSVLESALRHGAGKRVVVAVSGTADGARLSVCEPRSSLQAERQWAAAVPHCRAEEGVPCTGGLSLGLWVAQHVVEAHGGALQLTEDDDSVGVVVDLPRTTPPSKSPAR